MAVCPIPRASGVAEICADLTRTDPHRRLAPAFVVQSAVGDDSQLRGDRLLLRSALLALRNRAQDQRARLEWKG